MLHDGSATELEALPRNNTSRRSRSGCWTCRSKTVKKRCDQQQPACGRCSRLSLPCDYSARPTLAERRRGQEASSPTESSNASSDGTSQSPTSTIQSTTPPLSNMTLVIAARAACSLHLSSTDHEAVRYFRTEVSKSHHVKNSDYSLMSLMFNIAQEEPLVMHMVIAISLQEMSFRRPSPEACQRHSALLHYSSSIRLMTQAISLSAGGKDMDAIYTTLWMMLLYEQQFGDPQCLAYRQHLQGITSLVRYQSADPVMLTPAAQPAHNVPNNQLTSPHIPLSVYSARVLVWIAHLDAAAASFGVGGQVNTAILGMMMQGNLECPAPPTDAVKAFAQFHRYSNPLYRMVWGAAYPQGELLDDVENKDAYAFLATCVQLRFMTAQLTTIYESEPNTAIQRALDVEDAIDHAGETFAELLEVVAKSSKTHTSSRLILNLRAIVPMYYAIILAFMRLTAFDQPLCDRQRHALREISNLVFRSYECSGEEGMIKVAWPLFIAALETDDMIHRAWILERFEALRKYGLNFERAHDFLLEMIPIQQRLGKRVDAKDHMGKSTLFVLG